MADGDLVLTDLTDGVLVLTWNRPEQRNGWTIELEEAYFGALLDAAADPEVRVIVVTGAGTTFCPGLDMGVLAESSEGGNPMNRTRRLPLTLARRIPKPVIAAVNGAAAGIGFIQMLSADLRFVSSTAKFTTAFVRRGLPAENSSSWLLQRLVGTGVASDLLLSGRVFGPEEALAIGLVNRVVEPDELLPATLDYARDLAANCSPLAMRAIKAQLMADLERGSEESRLDSFVYVSECSAGPDFAEGVASFREKRPPVFDGVAAAVDVPRSWTR